MFIKCHLKCSISKVSTWLCWLEVDAHILNCCWLEAFFVFFLFFALRLAPRSWWKQHQDPYKMLAVTKSRWPCCQWDNGIMMYLLKSPLSLLNAPHRVIPPQVPLSVTWSAPYLWCGVLARRWWLYEGKSVYNRRRMMRILIRCQPKLVASTVGVMALPLVKGKVMGDGQGIIVNGSALPVLSVQCSLSKVPPWPCCQWNERHIIKCLMMLELTQCQWGDVPRYQSSWYALSKSSCRSQSPKSSWLSPSPSQDVPAASDRMHPIVKCHCKWWLSWCQRHDVDAREVMPTAPNVVGMLAVLEAKVMMLPVRWCIPSRSVIVSDTCMDAKGNADARDDADVRGDADAKEVMCHGTKCTWSARCPQIKMSLPPVSSCTLSSSAIASDTCLDAQEMMPVPKRWAGTKEVMPTAANVVAVLAVLEAKVTMLPVRWCIWSWSDASDRGLPLQVIAALMPEMMPHSTKYSWSARWPQVKPALPSVKWCTPSPSPIASDLPWCQRGHLPRHQMQFKWSLFDVHPRRHPPPAQLPPSPRSMSSPWPRWHWCFSRSNYTTLLHPCTLLSTLLQVLYYQCSWEYSLLTTMAIATTTFYSLQTVNIR